MSRGTWAVEKEVAAVWTSDGTIYRPNESMTFDYVSTQTKISLADGSRAFMIPETRYNKEPLKFTWLEIPNTDSLKNKIQNYIINADYLRITTHLGDQLTGRFVTMSRVWLTNVTDTYDIACTFELMD